MKNIKILSCIFIITLVSFGCKNSETKEVEAEVQITEPAIKKTRLILTEEQKMQTASIMANAMQVSDVSTFSSVLVTAGLSDSLLFGKGPYTLFAPNNPSFTKMPEKTWNDYLHNDQREKLITLAKSHVLLTAISPSELTKKINDSKGSYKLKTMSGATINATLIDGKITLTDANKRSATVINENFDPTNGNLFVLDNILFID